MPPFLRNAGRGWITAEYGMLPRATLTRTPREAERGKVGGRTHEIQRLIGRSVRAAVDLEALGPRACDSVGAYQLEGLGAQLFERIEGDYFTILGLPLLPLLDFLRRHGAVPA